jgi:hypothetical protein
LRSGFCAQLGRSRNKVVRSRCLARLRPHSLRSSDERITSLQTSLQRFGPSIAKTLQFKTYLFVELTLNQWPNRSSQTTIGYEPGEGIVSRPIQTVASLNQSPIGLMSFTNRSMSAMVKGALNRLEPHASSVKLLLGAIVVGEYGASDLRLAGEPSALAHGAPLIEQEGNADDGYTLRPHNVE